MAGNARLNLCLNCLEPKAVGVEVGPTKGPQMDTWRESVQLCPACREALLGGDFETLSSRFTNERVVRRAEV